MSPNITLAKRSDFDRKLALPQGAIPLRPASLLRKGTSTTKHNREDLLRSSRDNGKTAIVIVGHGSRVAESRGIYEEIARKVREKSGIEAQVGYMKHWKPTIAETISTMVEKGIKKIVTVPLFLLPGLHVTDDIPVLLGLKEGELPEFGYGKIKTPKGVEILYAGHIGADDRLADVVLDRVKEVLDGSRHEHEVRSGLKIEEQSFKIIDKELGNLPFPEGEIVKRVIHATADFEFKELIVFNSNAVERGIEAIRAGKNIITDVEMVKAGINSKALKKYGGEVKCFIDSRAVHISANDSGKTRASCAFRFFKHELHESIVAVGNAPTALFELCKLVNEGIKPSLVIAVPLGFVGAKEAKEKILSCDVPSIVVRGNRGGSTVAAAIVNALIKLADEHA